MNVFLRVWVRARDVGYVGGCVTIGGINKRVLELGAGTGLLGMLASRLGARCAALTDGDDVAVELLQRNLDSASNRIDGTKARARRLLWGNDDNDDVVVREEDRSDAFEGWCREAWPDVWSPDEAVSFDYVLAGDVMYKEGLPRLFFETARRFLKRGGDGTAALLLCHVPRSTVSQEVVRDAAEEAGFVIVEVSTDLRDLPEGCVREDAERAAIYRVTHKV